MLKIQLDTVLVCPSWHCFEHNGWTGQSPEFPWNLIILWFCIVTGLSKPKRMRLYPIQILVLEWKGFFQKHNQTRKKPLWPLCTIISIHITTCLIFMDTNTMGFDSGFSWGAEVVVFIVKISHAFLYQNCQGFYATIKYIHIHIWTSHTLKT